MGMAAWVDNISTIKGLLQDFHANNSPSLAAEVEHFVLEARKRWPRFATLDEDVALVSSWWLGKYGGKRVIMWDDTNINIPAVSDAHLNRHTYSAYNGAKDSVSTNTIFPIDKSWWRFYNKDYYRSTIAANYPSPVLWPMQFCFGGLAIYDWNTWAFPECDYDAPPKLRVTGCLLGMRRQTSTSIIVTKAAQSGKYLTQVYSDANRGRGYMWTHCLSTLRRKQATRRLQFRMSHQHVQKRVLLLRIKQRRTLLPPNHRANTARSAEF